MENYIKDYLLKIIFVEKIADLDKENKLSLKEKSEKLLPLFKEMMKCNLSFLVYKKIIEEINSFLGTNNFLHLIFTAWRKDALKKQRFITLFFPFFDNGKREKSGKWAFSQKTEELKYLKLALSNHTNKNLIYRGDKRSSSIFFEKENNVKIVVKEFLKPKPVWFWRNDFKSWRCAKTLNNFEIPATEYLAWFKRKKNGASAIFMNYVGEEHLRKVLPNLNEEKRLITLWKLAVFIGFMHNLGIYHSDLNLKNIIFNELDENLYLIDLDDIDFYAEIPQKYRVRNLAQIFPYLQKAQFTDFQIKKFLAYYRFVCNISKKEFKDILMATQKIEV